jgi:hypothetical protein
MSSTTAAAMSSTAAAAAMSSTAAAAAMSSTTAAVVSSGFLRLQIRYVSLYLLLLLWWQCCKPALHFRLRDYSPEEIVHER